MDSPKHLKCLNEGKTGQYYRLAGSSNYKCKSCGTITNGREFEPIEFSWKEEPDKWRVWVEKRVSEETMRLVNGLVDVAKNPRVRVR